jgi:hypothetical protein
MRKDYTLKLTGMLAAIVASSVLLQGCLAAAIPMAIGAQAFTTYKAVQLTTGKGEAQIGFERESYSTPEKASLAKIHSLAIMPLSAHDTELEVSMAETLSAAGTFQVITPSKVLQSRSEGIDTINFNALTREERTDVIRSICRDLDADGLVYSRLVGSETSSNIWSFSRPNAVYQIEMTIYSSLEDRVIVVDKIKAKIVVGGNSNMADPNEVDRIVGAAMGERIQSAVR